MILFLSIIIPFYGSADKKLLQRCITSIRQQGMAEDSYEIILTEDVTRTTGGARNEGMKRAQGEYLLFVDADDVLMPASMLPCLALLHRESPDVFRFGFRKLSKAALAESHSSQIDYAAYPSGAAYMARRNFTGVVWAHFYRRTFMQQAGLQFCATSHFDDEELVAKAYACAGLTLVSDFPVYANDSCPASITRPATTEQRMQRIEAFHSMLQRLQTYNNLLQGEAVPALQRRIRFLTIDYLRQMYRNRCKRADVQERLRALQWDHLLPLSGGSYGWKYAIVRLVVNIYIRLFL